MHAEYVFLRMSGSTIMCKTQHMVNIEHRLAARSGAQVKRHKTFQNRRGAVYAAAIELPLALLGMWRRSLGDPRSALASAAGLPTFSKSLSLDRPRPVTMPRSYNMKKSVCAMVDPSVSISDERFTCCVSDAVCGLHFCSTVYTLCGVSAERCAFCAP